MMEEGNSKVGTAHRMRKIDGMGKGSHWDGWRIKGLGLQG